MRKSFGLLVFLAASAMADPKVVGGPIVVNVSQRSATVVWIVETDQAILHPPTGEARVIPSLHVEKTTLTGLQPNTKYTFEVGPDKSKGSFKTPPAAGGPFRFVVYGDTRTRPDAHRAVIKQLLQHGVPDFVTFSGDAIADEIAERTGHAELLDHRDEGAGRNDVALVVAHAEQGFVFHDLMGVGRDDRLIHEQQAMVAHRILHLRADIHGMAMHQALLLGNAVGVEAGAPVALGVVQ